MGMTNNKINIAIAEACGFMRGHPCDKCGSGRNTWLARNGKIVSEYDLPNYAADLNAMQGAAAFLRENHPLEYVKYASELTNIVARYNSALSDRFSISAHDASASQRAEAFLRTKSLWLE